MTKLSNSSLIAVILVTNSVTISCDSFSAIGILLQFLTWCVQIRTSTETSHSFSSNFASLSIASVDFLNIRRLKWIIIDVRESFYFYRFDVFVLHFHSCILLSEIFSSNKWIEWCHELNENEIAKRKDENKIEIHSNVLFSIYSTIETLDRNCNCISISSFNFYASHLTWSSVWNIFCRQVVLLFVSVTAPTYAKCRWCNRSNWNGEEVRKNDEEFIYSCERN